MTRYVALQPITHGGALAYNPGDPVHQDNVDTNGYVVGEQVAEADSDQARTLLRELGMLPADDNAADNVPAASDETGPAVFDPAQGTVEEVNAHLDQHPDQAEDVLAAERAGKGRAGILHGRHGDTPDVAEA